MSIAKKHRGQHYWLMYLPFIIIGIGLRFYLLFKSGSFVFDEYYTVMFARDVQTLIKLFYYENTPPFYYILYFFWQKFTAPTELGIRSFSLIFSLLQLPATYLLARKLTSRKEYLLTAVGLTSTSFFLIDRSVFGRMYSLGPLIATVFFFFALSKKNRRNTIGLGLSGILLSCTHLIGAFLTIATLIVLLFLTPKKRRSHFVIFSLAVLAPFLIWLGIQLPYRQIGSLGKGWYFKRAMSPAFPLEQLVNPLAAGLNSGALYVILWLLIILIGGQQFFPQKKLLKLVRSKKVAILAGGIIFTTLTGTILNFCTPQYYIPLAPLILVLISYLIWHKPVFPPFLISMLLLMFTTNIAILSVHEQPRACYDNVANYISMYEEKNDSIYLFPFFRKPVFDYYYSGSLETYPLGIIQHEDNDIAIMTENWQEQINEKNVALIADQITSNSGLIVTRNRSLSSGFDNDFLLLTELTKKGKIIDQVTYFDCSPNIWLFHFSPK